MPYEKHTWETGETITAEKLNNLENGIVSGVGNIPKMVYKIESLFDDEDNIYYVIKDDDLLIDIINSVCTGNIIALYDNGSIMYYYADHQDQTTNEIVFTSKSGESIITTDNNTLIPM